MPIWVLYSLYATVWFAVVNSFINEIAVAAGPFVLFYQVAGSILAGILYNIYNARERYRTEKKCVPEFNFVVKGQASWINIFAFICFLFILALA
jgi:hypothetical protein